VRSFVTGVKDHRPDLKQLVWILTVTADRAVPIAHRVLDGNTSDVDQAQRLATPPPTAGTR